jgi:hypothetical protein
MRHDLDHLPLAKRHELELVTRILFAEFEDALKGRNAPHRKAGRILKLAVRILCERRLGGRPGRRLFQRL